MGSTLRYKLLVFSIFESCKSKIEPKTMTKCWAILSWSFWFAYLGIWPTVDWNGNDSPEGSSEAALAGTALAVALSLPLGFLAARNTSPNKVIYQVSRVVLNTLRSIPELIMGIIFVAAVGFGMLPGVLALGLHSVGMVGKFFAEAIEHAHPAPIEATEASGATSMQVILHGVLPQVFPQFADVSMYRWEYNFRASTVMGMVGAGGIGTELVGSLRLLDYPQVSAVLLVILACVTVVDILSNMLRAKFR